MIANEGAVQFEETSSLDGASALVEALKAQGVEHIFGIISTHMMEAYDALLRREGPTLISGNHESALVYEADGYWRASGKPGVVFTSTGPGVANSMGAMGEAYACSSAVLNITSSIPLQHIGKNKGYLHDTKDQSGMLSTATAWNRLVDSAVGIPVAVADAFKYFGTSRPRPLSIEIPIDLWKKSAEASVQAAPSAPSPVTASEEAIDQVARAMRSASRPLIWAGGGVVSSGAFKELRTLAEMKGAPVIVTVGGKGALPADHELYVATTYTVGPVSTSKPLFELIENADLILAVGTRFARGSTVNWTLKLPANLIHIDIDPTELNKNYPAKVAIHGDAGAVLRQLIGALSPLPDFGTTAAYRQHARQVRTAHEAQLQKQGPTQCRILAAIREAIPREAIIVCDPTVLFSRWGNSAMPALSERGWMYAHGWTGIGFGFPAGIGARVGSGERRVISFNGDGGFQFNLQELATIKNSAIEGLVTVILNDGAYGALKDVQVQNFSRRHIGTRLTNPDFVRVAEAYGIEGVRVEGLAGLTEAIASGLGRKAPLIIDAMLTDNLDAFSLS